MSYRCLLELGPRIRSLLGYGAPQGGSPQRHHNIELARGASHTPRRYLFRDRKGRTHAAKGLSLAAGEVGDEGPG